MDIQIAEVALPYRIEKTFHYLVPSPLSSEIQIGSVVKVPFRKKTSHGFVIGLPEKTEMEEDKLKGIEELVFPVPIFDLQKVKLYQWIAEYYCHPIGEVFNAAIPKYIFDSYKKKRTQKRGKKSLATIEGFSSPKVVLSTEQNQAIEKIMQAEWNSTILLQGVTGSGKTEVYLQVIEKLLQEKKGAIVLVPEIALTPQMTQRFFHRFGDTVVTWHSGLTNSQRAYYWNKIFLGEAQIVVGARSAIFAPVLNLGIIIVDEEHELSFKQEDGFGYHARDVAIVRGKHEKCKIVLGSATPALETYYNATTGKYLHLHLKKKVIIQDTPEVNIVNMRTSELQFSEKSPWLSKMLVEKIQQTLDRGMQTILYLNRLGYANFIYCLDCGWVGKCSNCDVSLTYYRSPARLKCHYCGAVEQVPNTCSQCSGVELDTMGLGTEKLEAEIREIFPLARMGRLDRTEVRNQKELEKVIQNVLNRNVDILIGTQMISKGHDFPHVSLVGVISADLSLQIPDFRAQERTFQILTQVSGRAGRATGGAEVVIQSVQPEHSVIQFAAKQRLDEFYVSELENRKKFGFPPFTKLAMMRFQHTNPFVVEKLAHQVVAQMQKDIQKWGWGVELLGPAEAPIAKIRKLHRWQALIKAVKHSDLRKVVTLSLQYQAFLKTTVQVRFEIDPIHTT